MVTRLFQWQLVSTSFGGATKLMWTSPTQFGCGCPISWLVQLQIQLLVAPLGGQKFGLN